MKSTAINATDAFASYRRMVHDSPRPDGVSPDVNTPITLQIESDGFGGNRAITGFRVITCPAYVWVHVFGSVEILSPDIVKTLVSLNHTFEVLADRGQKT